MAHDESEQLVYPGDLCDKCSEPLPEPRRWYCNLGEGCCPDCFTGCKKAGRCDKVRDPETWARIERRTQPA